MLYGRDVERSRIAALLDGARSGRSGVLVLRGEAGVGKSALLQSAREQAAGMTVISGCGIESEARLPYAGLHQIIRPILDQADKLARPQARALAGARGLEPGAGDEWFLVSLAVLSLLAEAADTRPLLCLVDDAHWLDDASAASLVFAGRRLEAEGVAMLFAAREGEARSFDAPGLPELRLDGLDFDAAAALLDGQVGTSLSPETRDRLIVGTGGNPLALIELSSTLGEPQLGGVEPLLEPLPVERASSVPSLRAWPGCPRTRRPSSSSPPPKRAARSRRSSQPRSGWGAASRRSTLPSRRAWSASTHPGSSSAIL